MVIPTQHCGVNWHHCRDFKPVAAEDLNLKHVAGEEVLHTLDGTDWQPLCHRHDAVRFFQRVTCQLADLKKIMEPGYTRSFELQQYDSFKVVHRT